jgi:rhamnosyl/mannosyltransferase
LKSSLEELASSLGLGDRVTFTGFIGDEELLERYHAADVLVLPSIDAGEAFGYVLLEAMICSTAIISTELGTGTSFVNAHGETGLVVRPNDVDALKGALNQLAGDRALLERFRHAARRRVLDHFTIQRMLRETEELYARCREAGNERNVARA